jgi:hypothetical protein
MNYLILTSAILGIGAAMDGKSTIDFITQSKGGMVEGDPVMVYLYGTDKPSSFKVIVVGAAVIAAEITLAFLACHFFPHLKPFFAAQQLIQAGVHIYEYFRNEKDLAEYLKGN